MVSVEGWFLTVFGWIGNCGYIWDVVIVLRSKSGDFAQRVAIRKILLSN